MAALSGEQIKSKLEADLEERLVISPLLEPEEQLRKDQASIDIRLGSQFALIVPSLLGSIDEFDRNWDVAQASKLHSLYSKKYVPLGDKLVLHPHQFALAETLEYIRLPKDLMAYVVGRSTWGRLGLIVATAIGVHPGFAGCLTLELRNLGETPLVLYPGQSIAQLFIHNVRSSEEGQEGMSQYSGSVDLVPKKMSSDLSKSKIKKLIEKYNRIEEQE